MCYFNFLPTPLYLRPSMKFLKVEKVITSVTDRNPPLCDIPANPASVPPVSDEAQVHYCTGTQLDHQRRLLKAVR